jgi:hypothetical protein
MPHRLGGIHQAANAIKTFLRDLREPLLTHELYKRVLRFEPGDDQAAGEREVRNMILTIPVRCPAGCAPCNLPMIHLDTVASPHQLSDHAGLVRMTVVRSADLIGARGPPAVQPRHLSTLRALVMFLTEVIEQSDKNGMTVSNVAIVFSPNLCWAKGAGPASGKIPVRRPPCRSRFLRCPYCAARRPLQVAHPRTRRPLQDLKETKKMQMFTEFMFENCGSIFAGLALDGYVETTL